MLTPFSLAKNSTRYPAYCPPSNDEDCVVENVDRRFVFFKGVSILSTSFNVELDIDLAVGTEWNAFAVGVKILDLKAGPKVDLSGRNLLDCNFDFVILEKEQSIPMQVILRIRFYFVVFCFRSNVEEWIGSSS